LQAVEGPSRFIYKILAVCGPRIKGDVSGSSAHIKGKPIASSDQRSRGNTQLIPACNKLLLGTLSDEIPRGPGIIGVNSNDSSYSRGSREVDRHARDRRRTRQIVTGAVLDIDFIAAGGPSNRTQAESRAA